MKGNIKVKVQNSGMNAIHQRDFTVTIHPLKMRGNIQDLGLAKRRVTQLKPEKIQIDDLSSHAEKLYTEAHLEDWSKIIADEINAA